MGSQSGFGLRQGQKVRVIDEYAASRVNDALASTETIDPDTLDTISVNVKAHSMDSRWQPTTGPHHRPWRVHRGTATTTIPT